MAPPPSSMFVKPAASSPPVCTCPVVQVQELQLLFNDPALLLPVVIEHTLDERSPLYGHTTQSLEVLRGGFRGAC